MDVSELDPNFFDGPFRARSNTWPLRPREQDSSSNTPPPIAENGESVQSPESVEDGSGAGTATPSGTSTPGQKKTSSRRNAWGNMSYADLITSAIQNSPEQRLTLSQIYDWMVQNVPYFKDKGDSNSSAGWKNSIRHNLSLHSRFMRIQNEGAGKSSWWVINPDAKPGKSPRRRATSMDTKAYEKKRGRVKKKLEQLRALESGQSPKSSSIDFSENELLSDNFNLSPQDFRARTSSNASSIGGRLSPIQSAFEPDLHDNQVPPMSPVSWKQPNLSSNAYTGDAYTDLAEMFDAMQTLDSMAACNQSMGNNTGTLPAPSSGPPSQLSTNSSGLGFHDQLIPAPPPYQEAMRQSPQPPNTQQTRGAQQQPHIVITNTAMSSGSSVATNPNINNAFATPASVTTSGPLYTTMSDSSNTCAALARNLSSILSSGNLSDRAVAQALTKLLSESEVGNNPSLYPDPIGEQDPMLSASRDGTNTPMEAMSPYPMSGSNHSAFQPIGVQPDIRQQQQPSQHSPQHSPHGHIIPEQQMNFNQKPQLSMLLANNNSLLRQALTQQQQHRQQQAQHGQQPQTLQELLNAPDEDLDAMNAQPIGVDDTAAATDIDDVNITELQASNFPDVQQILDYELSIDNSLDLNFDSLQGPGSGTVPGSSGGNQYSGNIVRTT